MLISAVGLSAVITLVLAAQSEGTAPPETPPAEAASPPAPDFGSVQAPEAPASEPGKKKKGKKDKGDKPADPIVDDDLTSAIARAIEVKGRVFFLAAYRDELLDAGAGEVADSGLSLSLASARAGFKATVRENFSLTLEAEFSGSRAVIRDGYIQAKNKRFLLRAGRFKMPTSAFTLESPWRLPRAERGVLDDVLSELMLLSGRREGLMGRFDGGGFWDFAVTAGVFQSVGVSEPEHVTSVVRLSIEPGATEIALVGQRRSALVAGEARAFNSTGIDLVSTAEVLGLGLRTWAEAYVGQSWFHQPDPGVDATALARGPAATYLQGRVMAALRVGGARRDDRYAELFFSGGVLDPDLDIRSDLFVEVSGGINLGHWETTRLTFEVVRAQSGRNLPDAIFRDAVLATVVRRTAALLQLGAAF